MGNLQNSSKLILVQWWPRGWRNEYLSHPWGLQIKESWPQPALRLFSVAEPYSGGIQNIYIFFFSKSWHLISLTTSRLGNCTCSPMIFWQHPGDRSTEIILWGYHSQTFDLQAVEMFWDCFFGQVQRASQDTYRVNSHCTTSVMFSAAAGHKKLFFHLCFLADKQQIDKFCFLG